MLSFMLSGILTAAAPSLAPGSASLSSEAVFDLSASWAPATTVLATMHRVSLDPGSVAAAGLSLNEALGLLTAAAAAIDANLQQLAAADEALAAAQMSVDALERSIRAGHASDPQAAVVELSTARVALVSAKAALDAVLASVTEAAMASLSSGQRTSLAAIRASAPNWSEIPAAYRVVPSSDEALVTLRNALAAERIAAATGEVMPDDATATLAQWAQMQAVSAALAASEANASLIAASWATALQPDQP